MFRMVYRQFLLDPTRSVLTSFAIAVVVAVILILEGFETGLYYQARRAVLERGADLIVMQAGVSNLIAARSSLRQLARADVEAVAGVANAHPLTAIPVIYNQNDVKQPVYVWVYDTLGGPAKVEQGKPVTDGRDIVIDLALADKYGLRPGDQFVVSDFAFTISGITRNEAALFTSFAFINYDGLIDLFLESEIAPDISTFPLLSFLLVELAPGVAPFRVAEQIERQVPDADVYTPTQLASNDVRLSQDLFGPVMGFLVGLAYVIGSLVVALIMYAEVRTRLRNFGVLKALGFPQRYLTQIVLLQTVLVFLVAFPFAVLLAQGIGAFINWSAPLYLVQVVVPVIMVKTFFAGFAFALVGAVVPVRIISRLDPMLVFQGY